MEFVIGALAVLVAIEGFVLLLLWTHIKRLYGLISVQADLGGKLASTLAELLSLAKGVSSGGAKVSPFPRDVSKPPA